ncbi:MAG: nitrogenase cofactor biosynthesis protein NifB [Colwellia sp.]
MKSDINRKQHENRFNDSRVQTHPCYSKDAHQYSRIHLPVAPACNIQCNYCNRKFDCSNESRPGVVSKLLSPAEAIHRFQAVKARLPDLKVVGIAGPGDALANVQATFATLKGIKAIDEDVHLCISTNGLNLSKHVDTLADIGVHHLTITMNTLRPEIAANIYPWIYFNNQRYKGIEGAKILIAQQLEGLSLASDAGILVKVNTVLLPGINDQGLSELAEEIQTRGALLHNIMPLISDPSHGTFFGINHFAGPSEEQINNAREVAGSNMPQMSHCQQCRADAVGKLGADQSCSSSQQNLPVDSSIEKSAVKSISKSIRIAVATSDGQVIDTHFGHAKQFHIFDISDMANTSDNQVDLVEIRSIEQYCKGIDDCNDEPNSLKNHLTSLKDCQQVLCSRIGMEPWKLLEQHNITPSVDYAMLGVSDSLNIIGENLFSNSQAKSLQEAC